MPGRPDQREDRARLGVGLDAAVLAQLAHGQVLGDAVLDVLQAGVVGVEHRARGHGVEVLVRALAPRHGDQPVQVGADHARLARLLAHALQARELLQSLLVDGLGHLGLLDLRAVLVGDRGVVLAELLADRVHLLAQEVLALLLLGALLDVLADALADLQLGQALALEPDGQLEALGHVERAQQLDLLLVGEVGGVAGRVGQRAGLGDRAQERRDAPVVAAQLEDLLDGRAVLALELARASVDGHLVGALVDLDAQLAAGAGLGGADQRAVLAGEGDRVAAAGQADLLGDLGDRADLEELVLVARHEHDALVIADVDRQRDAHVREHDRVVEWDQAQDLLGYRCLRRGALGGLLHGGCHVLLSPGC